LFNEAEKEDKVTVLNVCNATTHLFVKAFFLSERFPRKTLLLEMTVKTSYQNKLNGLFSLGIEFTFTVKFILSGVPTFKTMREKIYSNCLFGNQNI
jgi:hypothetical protein